MKIEEMLESSAYNIEGNAKRIAELCRSWNEPINVSSVRGGVTGVALHRSTSVLVIHP